jgi:hypothetical protein
MVFILDDITQLTVVRSKILKMVTKNTVYWEVVKRSIAKFTDVSEERRQNSSRIYRMTSQKRVPFKFLLFNNFSIFLGNLFCAAIFWGDQPC